MGQGLSGNLADLGAIPSNSTTQRKTMDDFKCMPKMAAGGSAKPGLYANIHVKSERIAKGSGEKMRKPGSEGAPTAKAFRESAKTAK